MRALKAILATLIAVSTFQMNTFAAGNKLVIEGSTTVLPIAQPAAEEFMDRNPDANIVVRGGGSSVGITSLIAGTCDIADASRAMKDTELQKASGKGMDPKANVIAIDGIAVIVNTENDIDNLTKQQIKDIYTGKIGNWSQLGLSDEKIVVISRDSASGTYEAFGELALNKAKVRPDALLQASNQAVSSTVARTRGGIGYIGMGYLTNSVKAIKVGGIPATKETVLSGKYPYARPLFMYTKGAPQGLAKQYIDFILSPEGKKIIEQEGFVAVK